MNSSPPKKVGFSAESVRSSWGVNATRSKPRSGLYIGQLSLLPNRHYKLKRQRKAYEMKTLHHAQKENVHHYFVRTSPLALELKQRRLQIVRFGAILAPNISQCAPECIFEWIIFVFHYPGPWKSDQWPASVSRVGYKLFLAPDVLSLAPDV